MGCTLENVVHDLAAKRQMARADAGVFVHERQPRFLFAGSAAQAACNFGSFLLGQARGRYGRSQTQDGETHAKILEDVGTRGEAFYDEAVAEITEHRLFCLH